jgi:sensor histidine kinase YesM
MRLLAAIRSYFDNAPVPMRTVFLAAGMLSVLFVYTSFIGRTHMGTDPSLFDWWKQAPIPFLNFFTWAALLPLLNIWSKRWPLKGHPNWRPILIHFGLALVLCTLHEAFNSTLYMFILNYSGTTTWQPEMLPSVLLSLPAGIVQRFMEYWLFLVLLMYKDTHRQVREERTRVLQLQNELQTTQLLALKKQLQPHFLFNTLNTVSALMDEDTKSARTVLAKLGQLLRITLDEERRERVTLIHEIDHVGNYLGIEAIRFKDRLQVRYDIPSECQNALVPSMVLQPLVENSIKHGLDTTNAEVCITIEAERRADKILLTVSDNGRGCTDVKRVLAKGGIGLRNLRERLSLLHGPESQFQVTSDPGSGFHVLISLPFETKDRTRHEEYSYARSGR